MTMKGTWMKGACIVCCLGLLAAAAGLAAAPPKEIAVGKTAPEFKLPGVDGKQYALADLLKKNKAVVVVFTCNHCPVAVAYEDRLIALQKDYEKKGIQIVAINSNRSDYPGEGLEKMKERAKDKKFNFPYVLDEGNKVADAYGALVTPHIFLVDAKGKVVYRGAIDNSQNPKRIEKHYLRDALNSVLASKEIAVASTKAFGCTIKRVEK